MQLGVMHKVAPDDLSPTLAEMGGWLRISLALIAKDRGDSPSRAPHQKGGGGEPAAAPRVVLINLSPDETRPFCAHERQRLTERQSFVFSVNLPATVPAIVAVMRMA
jgi:hypothetical protein